MILKKQNKKNRGCANKAHIEGRYQKEIERNNFKEKNEGKRRED